RLAARRPIPDDWLYVYNFERPDYPLSLRLPAGDGGRFRSDMAELVEAVRGQVRRTFESLGYRNLRENIHRGLEDQRRQLLEDLNQRARSRGFAISFAPDGTSIIPLSDDRQMTAEEVARLPDEEKERLRERGEEFSPSINETLDQVHRLERETHERITEADA